MGWKMARHSHTFTFRPTGPVVVHGTNFSQCGEKSLNHHPDTSKVDASLCKRQPFIQDALCSFTFVVWEQRSSVKQFTYNLPVTNTLDIIRWPALPLDWKFTNLFQRKCFSCYRIPSTTSVMVPLCSFISTFTLNKDFWPEPTLNYDYGILFNPHF